MRIVLSLLVAVAAVAPVAAQTRDPLADLKLPNATIVSSEVVAAGAFVPPGGASALPGPSPYKGLPPFRRVVGVAKPTSDSEIRFEVWLPVSGWNEKFLGVGNGGFAGTVSYDQMAEPLSKGFAVASTDTGHTGTAEDATWAVGHPERIVDFGYRAIHETTVKAKAIAAAFYGKAPKRSYFFGCSNGGRQALMEAQRYPDDYDGIVAGAPANYWTHLVTQGAYVAQVTTADPASYIPAAKMKAIEAAALASCDAADGLKDGVLGDPAGCRFDPSVLLCSGAETDACLTAKQVEALKKIYAGPRDAKGAPIYPGLVPGGETGFFGWEVWVAGPAPGQGLLARIAGQFFKSMVFEDQSWDVAKLDVARDVALADRKFAAILNATDPDLTAFKARGGKLIVFHGWSDAAIAPENAIHYYESVVAKMGRREADAFLRLYMVPGMQHCFGGPGPNSFGQALPCTQCDARHDVFTALVGWVEQGAAPDVLVATKYANDFVPANPVRTRPLCPYPATAKYNGTGSVDDAASFTCVAPRR